MADSKSEAREIKRMGGKAQPNSGRGNHAKGDAILGDMICYDVKEYSKSFSVSKEVWAKVCTDAFRAGQKEPALNLVLGSEQKLRLWVVGEEMFKQMYEAWIKEYGE